MEFLQIPFYDDDVIKLLFRFIINLIFLLIIVRLIYYPKTRRKDYLFTYIMISMVVFFLCFTLKKFDLGLGMALGLFAIFGILRYRTSTIPIKEMTYLFMVIGLAVINALVNKKMSFMELIFVNSSIVIVCFILERMVLLKHETKKAILYEKIDLIKPENYALLKADLEQRTGLTINRVEVGKIDYLKDIANVRIYFYEANESMNSEDD